LLVWPVVPRGIVNAIHRGQVEVIRVLTGLGWRLRIILSDCAAIQAYRPEYVDTFSDMVSKYASWRDIREFEVTKLSALFDAKAPTFDAHQDRFRRVASELSLGDVLNMNNKQYSETVQASISGAATLEFMRPVLTISAVIEAAKEADHKVLVVSGKDELIQWERTMGLRKGRERIGVLMNPVLRVDQDSRTYQTRQRDDYPIWDSTQALVRAMKETNLGWWAFCLHAFLPVFPRNSVSISGSHFSPTDWANEYDGPSALDPEELAKAVWPILNPACP
jgi:hypothetical protein